MIYSIVVWGFDTDNDYQHDGDLLSCKADSELAAKIKFRLCNDFSDTKRYTIISVKGVKK